MPFLDPVEAAMIPVPVRPGIVRLQQLPFQRF